MVATFTVIVRLHITLFLHSHCALTYYTVPCTSTVVHTYLYKTYVSLAVPEAVMVATFTVIVRLHITLFPAQAL